MSTNEESVPSTVTTNSIPLLPLRDVVVYPQIVQPLFVGRPKSIKALETAMASDKKVLLVAQKSAADDDPSASDLYQIGTVATILQLIRLPDGTVKVLVEGLDRAKIKSVNYEEDYVTANVSVLAGEEPSAKEADALIRSLLAQFDHYVQLSKKIPPEVMSSISSIDEAGRQGKARQGKARQGWQAGRYYRLTPLTPTRREAEPAGTRRAAGAH